MLFSVYNSWSWKLYRQLLLCTSGLKLTFVTEHGFVLYPLSVTFLILCCLVQHVRHLMLKIDSENNQTSFGESRSTDLHIINDQIQSIYIYVNCITLQTNWDCWLFRLSPELHLKRPVMEGDRWRLDIILQRKAVEYLLIIHCYKRPQYFEDVLFLLIY